MDVYAPFQGVLQSQERLLWAGRPAQGPRFARMARPRYLAVLLAIGYACSKLLAHWQSPLPAAIQIELAAAVLILVAPLIWVWFHFRRIPNTVYAVTNQRLFIAVGARREKIRTVKLDQLAPVRLHTGRQGSTVVAFRVIGQYARIPIWTFLVSGKIDKWSQPTWRVDDPAALQELIETVRDRACNPDATGDAEWNGAPSPLSPEDVSSQHTR